MNEIENYEKNKKSKADNLIILLFVLTILHPIISIISTQFFKEYVITWSSIFILIIDFIFALLALIIIVILSNDKSENELISKLLALIFPLSLVNIIFLYSKSYESRFEILALISYSACTLFLSIAYGKPTALKIISLIISIVPGIVVLFFSYFGIMMIGWSENTVVKKIDSPNGKYYLELIDNDQGALGGATLINVVEGFEIDAIIFKITKKPRRLYDGKWGEFNDMDVHWKDDDVVVINDREYDISK